MNTDSPLLQTALYPLHVDTGAKLVPFAGYAMPVSYPAGIMKEHLHTRDKAGLFDVSHMGQILIKGADGSGDAADDDDAAARFLESLMPVDIVSLPIGRQRYGMLTNEDGGVLDDLMVIRRAQNEFILVVNAACKDDDFSYIEENLAAGLTVQALNDRSLIALQGPKSADVLTKAGCDVANMKFMDAWDLSLCGADCLVTRSGYTGEDGFEISLPSSRVVEIAERLLMDAEVMWVGLGARDSLRLEAGLSLYGHELTADTTPVEANLLWAISKSRRVGGDRAGGFPGADTILKQIPRNVERNVERILVALLPQGRAPIREGAVIESINGEPIGIVTSGGFAPSLGKPICLAYVKTDFCDLGTELNAVVRNKRLGVVITKLPFVAHGYQR